MHPIAFAAANVTFAEHQPEYRPLRAHRRVDDPQGVVTSCWALTWRERWTLLWRGRLWLQVMTFHQPLQPLLPRVHDPLVSHDD